jgi:membrane-associated protein
MNYIISFLYQHLDYSHWIIFGLLILAGINVPVSEDLLLVTAGILASTIVPEYTMQIFIFAFFGCYLSDLITYWLGRIFGHKILNIKWFAKSFKKKRFQEISNFYEKYNFFTLLIGRFIPFGVRNMLFMTAGISKVSFIKFMINDGVACLFSNTVLFCLSYFFCCNCDYLLKCIKTADIVIIVVAVISIGMVLLFFYKKKKVVKYDDAKVKNK